MLPLGVPALVVHAVDAEELEPAAVDVLAQRLHHPAVFPLEVAPHGGGEHHWNFTIGFGLIFVGLIVSAHKKTPLGRGRGVVIGMLGCFLIGLFWVVTSTSSAATPVPVMRDLGQNNLFVGIAFMAVGFAFATKWE